MNELGDRRDILTCREHHSHIEELLATFPALEAANASKLVARITLLKTLLLRHLSFEDEHLYPRLQSSPDPIVVEAATRYQIEMGGLAPQCVAFFEAWTSTETVAGAFDAFLAQWTAVRGALERRIMAEDTELYELAERI